MTIQAARAAVRPTQATVWDCDLPRHPRRGAYIAISGNTAAGKSSLIAEAERRLLAQGTDAIGVSERIFHSPFLRLMFSEPADFAFPVQLSFMLNRHMVLLRNLVELGRTVVMERSHLEDALFVEEHVRSGAITEDQRQAYTRLADVLHARLPVPDVIVLMNPDPAVSLQRLAIAESRGERPAEFPSEEAKAAWVHRWHGLYVELHKSFAVRKQTDPAFRNTTIIEADPTADRDRIVEEIIGIIRAHHRI